MIIKSIPNQKKYVRKIEGMGEGLVLFEVSSLEKRLGQNYHLFYADKRKPPFDIAINPFGGTIEYVSYFIQDEMIECNSIKNEIINSGVGISITHEDFNENNVHINLEGEFEFAICENNIWIFRTDIGNSILTEYGIDESNGLLFDNNHFWGMVLKKLSEEEIQEIRNSNCLL